MYVELCTGSLFILPDGEYIIAPDAATISLKLNSFMAITISPCRVSGLFLKMVMFNRLTHWQT